MRVRSSDTVIEMARGYESIPDDLSDLAFLLYNRLSESSAGRIDGETV